MTEGPPRAQHDDLALTNYVRYVAMWVTFTEAVMDWRDGVTLSSSFIVNNCGRPQPNVGLGR